MPSLPRALQGLPQVVLGKAPAAMKVGKNAVNYAKPALATGLDAGKHFSNSALARARPLIQASLKATKSASAAALIHVAPGSPNAPDLRETLNALRAHAKLLLPSGLHAGKRALQPVIPVLLTLANMAQETIRRHPWVSGFATLYVLLSLVLGPFWPLGVALRIVGFGAKGVVLGECSLFLIVQIWGHKTSSLANPGIGQDRKQHWHRRELATSSQAPCSRVCNRWVL
jgi:hypothetical protein